MTSPVPWLRASLSTLCPPLLCLLSTSRSAPLSGVHVGLARSPLLFLALGDRSDQRPLFPDFANSRFFSFEAQPPMPRFAPHTSVASELAPCLILISRLYRSSLSPATSCLIAFASAFPPHHFCMQLLCRGVASPSNSSPLCISTILPFRRRPSSPLHTPRRRSSQ